MHDPCQMSRGFLLDVEGCLQDLLSANIHGVQCRDRQMEHDHHAFVRAAVM